jgi:hypothetical protein
MLAIPSHRPLYPLDRFSFVPQVEGYTVGGNFALREVEMPITKLVVITGIVALVLSWPAFGGEATKVYLTCYWVCKKWKTGYYGPHCVKYVQDCKLRPERMLPPPPAKTTPQ